jgi:hypothetical protein
MVGMEHVPYVFRYRSVLQRKPVLTFKGWCALTTLTALAQVDVLKPPRVETGEFSHHGYLDNLPERPGSRPTVRRTATTEQVNQRASQALIYWTRMLFQSYQTRYPQHLHIKSSYLEPVNDALFWDIGDRPVGTIHQPEEWGGEIAHVHGVDGSLRVALHPEDVRKVIEEGWGERHPLCANDKHWFRLLFHGIMEQRLPVPEGLVVVYAPRDEGELQILDAILEAAVWYTTRGELFSVVFGAEHPRTEDRDSAQPRCASCCMARRNCTALPPPSGGCVCTCTCAARQNWEDATKELQAITLPMMGGDLALLNPHRVWSTPDSVTTWGADTGTRSPPPPFEPLSFPEYEWSGCALAKQIKLTADENVNLQAGDVNQKEVSSRFSPRPDFLTSPSGPAASPQSCIDILERAPIALPVAIGATGRLHPEGAEGRVGALAVGHHWLQYEEERQEKVDVTRGAGDDAFTEDDFF